MLETELDEVKKIKSIQNRLLAVTEKKSHNMKCKGSKDLVWFLCLMAYQPL